MISASGVPTTSATAGASGGAATPEAGPARLHLLTFFRFAAALWILLLHLQSRLHAPWPSPLPVLFENGAYAMSFFFILSGTVLAYGYFDLTRREHGAARFFAARFARIYPAYAVTHLLCLPWMGVPFPAEWIRWLYINTTSALGIQAWMPHALVGANGGTWSISCEFFFYAAFPALLPLTQRLARPDTFRRTALYLVLFIGFLGMADFVFAGQGTYLYYVSPLVRLPEFILGMLIGAALRQRPVGTKISVWPMLLAGLGVVLVSLNTAHRVGLWTRANLIVVPAIAALIYWSAAYELARRGRFEGGLWGMPRYLGEVSYCFFLAQMPVLGWFDVARLGEHPVVRWAMGSPLLGTVACFFVVLAGAIVLHEAVEKPVRRIVLHRWPWGRNETGTGRAGAQPETS